MRFVWDPKKAADNLDKHGVSFEEASAAFNDRMAVYLPDEEHPERGNLIGHSASMRMLFVVHVQLLAEFPPTTRIISAWQAEAKHRAKYAAQFEPPAKPSRQRPKKKSRERPVTKPLPPKQRRIRHEED